MTATPAPALTAAESARVAAFDRAPYPVEVAEAAHPAEESVDLTPGVVWTDAQLAIVRRLVGRAQMAETAALRVMDALTQMDEHADTMDNTAEAWKRLDNQPDWARCAAVADALREHAGRIRAALAPQPADAEGTNR